MGNRSFKFDNWKALLIILMVFGHFLEISSPLFQENPIYKFIYLFHLTINMYTLIISHLYD